MIRACGRGWAALEEDGSLIGGTSTSTSGMTLVSSGQGPRPENEGGKGRALSRARGIFRDTRCRRRSPASFFPLDRAQC